VAHQVFIGIPEDVVAVCPILGEVENLVLENDSMTMSAPKSE
jgi:hypothetical protein